MCCCCGSWSSSRGRQTGRKRRQLPSARRVRRWRDADPVSDHTRGRGTPLRPDHHPACRPRGHHADRDWCWADCRLRRSEPAGHLPARHHAAWLADLRKHAARGDRDPDRPNPDLDRLRSPWVIGRCRWFAVRGLSGRSHTRWHRCEDQLDCRAFKCSADRLPGARPGRGSAVCDLGGRFAAE